MDRAALLSLVTACIAFTVSETALFAPLRERLRARLPWLGKLISCGYCLGCWVAFGLTAIYRPRLFVAWEPLDLLLTALAIAWFAAFQWAALCWLLAQTGK
jgi:hypothetical protein